MMAPGLSVAFAALAGLLADGGGLYLPPSETGGSEFQFNPASPDLRQAAKKREPRPDDLLDARAVADDLVFLRRALRKQYIGYPELLQLPEFDVEDLFDQHIARLRSGPAKVKFADSLRALFLEMKSHITDHHFNMGGVDRDPLQEYAEYQTAIEGPAPELKGCTAPRMSPTTLRVAPLLAADGKRAQLLTVSATRREGTLELACGERRFTLSARPQGSSEQNISDKPAYEWRRAGQAAILRIRRFDGPPADEQRLDQLAADYPQHRRSPLIVVDLRGNSGGNDGYAYRWVAQARRGVWDSGTWSLHPAGSFLPWQKWNQEVWASLYQDRIDDPASVARRDKLRAEWPRSAAQLSVEFKPHRNQTDAKLPYKGRVFVLVDRHCGSSGESAAMFLRQGLAAKVVGERTFGVQEYGNVRPFVLPRTLVRMYFATKRNYFTSPVEAVGMPVDVYLPPQLMQKPVEDLIPLLKKLPASPASPASRS